jgi:predicted transposase YdaD
VRQSSTYQGILEEGRIEGRVEGRTEGEVAEARKLLRLLGADAFGPPDAQTAAALERLNDLARLEELLRRVRTTGSWQDLLEPPPAGHRGRRRRRSP